MANIATSRARDEFAKIIGIRVEELLIDQYYWFEKSTKRKGILIEYMQLCNQEYGKMLEHSSTRWLSLERCIQRTLEKYTGLKSYFLSEDADEARFKRLQKAFENPLTEVSPFFHNDFEDQDIEDVLKRPAFCSRQGHEKKRLKFFCVECEETVCSSGVVTAHDGHVKILLEEASNEKKLQVMCIIESNKAKAQRMRNKISKLDESCHNIEANVAKVRRSA